MDALACNCPKIVIKMFQVKSQEAAVLDYRKDLRAEHSIRTAPTNGRLLSEIASRTSTQLFQF